MKVETGDKFSPMPRETEAGDISLRLVWATKIQSQENSI